MKVVIRADSSFNICTGHIMRCLTLAESLRLNGVEVIFISRELPGNCIAQIEKQGFVVHYLKYNPQHAEKLAGLSVYEQWLGELIDEEIQQVTALLQAIADIDWLIVDHYSLGERWESAIKKLVSHVMVIDDLANRRHVCDLLLDQNRYQDIDIRYRDYVSKHCLCLLGPRYALLRPEFAKLREKACVRDQGVHNLLVLLGGVDANNQTAKVLQAIEKIEQRKFITHVVLGDANPNKEKLLHDFNGASDMHFYIQPSNIAQLMCDTDLAIGSAGTISWERCCMGLPSLIGSIAENQEAVLQGLVACGAAMSCGKLQDVTADQLGEQINKLLDSPMLLKQISTNAMCLVDGVGVERVVDHLQRF